MGFDCQRVTKNTSKYHPSFKYCNSLKYWEFNGQVKLQYEEGMTLFLVHSMSTAFLLLTNCELLASSIQIYGIINN